VLVVHCPAPRLQVEDVVEATLAERATPYLLTDGDDGMALSAGCRRRRVGVKPSHRRWLQPNAAVPCRCRWIYLVVRHRDEPAAGHIRVAHRYCRGRPVVVFDDPGAYSLLFAAQPRESIEAVAAAVLRPLDEHDAANRGDLVRSLASLLRHNGHWESAAAMLGVRRHTLRYRIRKVEQLTGRQLNSAHDRAEFLAALAAREISDPSALQP
jgi:PucR C-terminal helix-turn-helix domain